MPPNKSDVVPISLWVKFLLRQTFTEKKTPEEKLWVWVIAKAIEDANYNEEACQKRQDELMAQAKKAESKGKHEKFLALRNDARAVPAAMLSTANEARRFLMSCGGILRLIGIEPSWFLVILKKHTDWAEEAFAERRRGAELPSLLRRQAA